MQLLGTHRVSFESIRRLTIECYALSRAAMSLLKHSDYEDLEGRTTRLYEELVSEKLLQLAIAIRTKFYQGVDHRRTSGYLEDTGTLLKGVSAKDESYHAYTLKDVCDKVIHADSVYLVLDSDLDVTYIDLHGKYAQGRETQRWMLSLLLPEVCEGILSWLDETTEA
jgi:hypothetical protein